MARRRQEKAKFPGQPWRGLLASLLAFATVSACAEETPPRWYGVDHGARQTRLAYGVPDSDDASLVFICDKGVPDLTVYITHPSIRAGEGRNVPLRLSDGHATVTFPATLDALGVDDPPRLTGRVPFDAPFESILAATGRLTIDAPGVTAHYPLEGIATAARPLIALCGMAARAAPAADQSVTVTNRTRRRVEQIALREPDSIESDSDAFGYDGLAPGRRRSFTIPAGAGVCTYEIAVVFEEKGEDCCSDPLPIGQQNLCDDPRIIVHD